MNIELTVEDNGRRTAHCGPLSLQCLQCLYPLLDDGPRHVTYPNKFHCINDVDV